MGLISKNVYRVTGIVGKLINGSELKTRVQRGGALLGTGKFSVLSPAEKALASLTFQGIGA
jgi:hypothetical protein